MNYIEYYLLSDSLTTGFTEEEFYNVLQKLRKTNYKYFQKEYKQYVIQNLFYENYDNQEVIVYEKNALKVNKEDPKWLEIHNVRNKLSMINLNSTRNVHSTNYVKKLIFRITNRIYINFEIKKNVETNTTSRYIYINYNHDQGVDMNETNRVVNEIKDTIF
jgi:hypothetical protein